MSGLIVLAGLITFTALLFCLSGIATKRLPISAKWKTPLRILMVAGILPLMIADEIVGKSQFDHLCQSNAILTIDSAGIRGRTVQVTSNQKILENTSIPVVALEILYRDVISDDVLAKVNGFSAKGGWLIRLITQSKDWPPLTFARSTCWPELSGELEDVYQFSIRK